MTNIMIMRIYCFDLDNTLCTSKDDNYLISEPLQDRIDKVNELFKAGNKIIISTARGSLTGKDWKEHTELQLASWKVNYHELWLGKPYADYSIDDKAIKDSDFTWD